MPTIASSSSSSWDEKHVQGARVQPDLLRSADLPHPTTSAADYLVAELTGFEIPSPFIIETISALVIVEEHQPGVNDLMTGAMDPNLQPRRTAEELAQIIRDDNDATLCRFDFQSLDIFMPYRLFDIREIATLGIFYALDNIDHLPANFHTTTLGLKKVWFEIWKGQVDAVYDDQQLLTELAKVGGVPMQQLGEENRDGVVYPEDLVPCTSEAEWDKDHRTYWNMLRDLGRTSWGEDGVEQEDVDVVE